MIDLKDIRVGYAPYASDFARPGDRRRFCYFAKKRAIRFEIADPRQEYDVVLLAGADISTWARYPHTRRTKIIFELIDSYLAVPPGNLKGRLRGIAKYVTGANRHLSLNYTEGLRAMCRRADAVICSTEEQKSEILQLCPNVHIILDFQSHEVHARKSEYSAGQPFNLVWEGLPDTLGFVSEISGVLAEINRRRPLAFHVVSSLEYGRYLGKYWKQQTTELARRLFQNVYLYAWHERVLSNIITACDLAIIPVPLQDPFAAGKPENKLLYFWRTAMPVVTSATPAYGRAMQQAGLAMTCSTTEDWLRMLEHYMSDEPARRDAGQRGLAYAEGTVGESALLEKWEALFHSVLTCPERSTPAFTGATKE